MKQKMISGIVSGVLFLLITIQPVFPVITYHLKDFEESGTKAGVGFIFVKDGDSLRPFVTATLSPDLKFGPLGLGLDAKLFVPTDGGTIPSDLQAFTFRMLSYDHDDVWGIKWGRLTNVNYGYGLLMDRYDSGNFGTSDFNTSKAGGQVYVNLEPVKVDLMYTATSVGASRVSYMVDKELLMGHPVYIGVNYVTDMDGVYNPDTPTVSVRSEQDGYSVDIGAPIFDDLLKIYAEYAQLVGHGSGFGTGFRGFLGQMFEYKIEYRILNKDFSPGYFNASYEDYALASDALPQEAINGFLAGGELTLMDGFIKSAIEYQLYDGYDPILSAALGWQKIGPTVGVMNYVNNFQSQNSVGVIQSSILFYDFPALPIPADVVVHARTTYGQNFDEVLDQSYAFEVRPNLQKLFPFFF